jgi:spermidine synthase
MRSDKENDEANAGAGQKARAGMLLPGVAFCAGAAVMIVELSGARLIAPLFGNTIYTWTALIGVVLVAMSAGGYAGGWLADRGARAGVVGLLLAAAGVASMLIPLLARGVEGMLAEAGLISGPLIMSCLLFVIPGILLGAVGPYSVKLLSVWRPDHAVGRSAGLISMSGALGSFAGTFATGFWLLSAFDLRVILAATGGFLCLLGGLVWWLGGGRGKAVALGAVLAGVAAWAGLRAPLSSDDGALFAKNTYYHLIRVKEDKDFTGRKVRLLMLDSTVEGGVYLEDGDKRGGDLPVAYQNYWRILANNPAYVPRRALFIGAGAFGMPLAVAGHWPEARVEVVEIDPEVISVGREWFGLGENPAVEAVADDGRRFLRRQEAGAYDLIFGDAYNGVSYIPPHLVTAEFFALVAARLGPGGVFMMNLISPLRDEQAPLAESVAAGVRAAFPHLAVFTVQRASARTRQNLVLLASHQPLDAFLDARRAPAGRGREFLASRVPESVLAGVLEGARPFTDHHNPVDRYIASLLLRDGETPRSF